ncbi:uncharacterized protein DNG_04502 [Cephalotrichum gorgonifer]|uniref:Major facilitator superfamily (MFS) profile domain-containing protein n=1 Tax=Cephalotrichum gorgonifer TaxID=2041049 RepID=A0AAE8SUZ4_9PEZI|nr:uncharacterized protein DNG_04502 [Cephalotrichum gorgonifer]
MAPDSKSDAVVAVAPSDHTFGHESTASGQKPKTLWGRVKVVLWDGPRPEEERKLIQRLDIFLMSWATFGYFIRLLDSSNITNAYVSGMNEDLAFHGNQYNLLQTFFTCGYLVGQIPSQFLLTKIRPSVYLPTVELLWTIVTFTFAAVRNTRDVFALRFLLGMLESPFAVGVLTIMGKLSKRIAIFYSASYAASMFSGYLQAAIYRGLDGAAGLPGWRWLFIFCGIISIWGPLWGFYAVPDNPYTTRARWLTQDERERHIARMTKVDRKKPVPLTWAKVKRIATHWPLYVFTFTLICHCVVTQPLNYFAVWLKSLNRFSVYQINLFPTAGQAVGLVFTLLYGWLSDGLNKRWQILIIPATFNFVGMVMVVAYGNYASTFAGYLMNAASWGFWPVLYAWAIEIMHEDMEERAIVIGVAQTFGQAFIAWVPVLILNVGKYAPRFHLGFAVMSGISVLQASSIFLILYFSKREKRLHSGSVEAAEDADLFRNLVLSYMKRQRTIILAVVSAKSDFALQEVTQLARKLDPEGIRTLGLITKPDTLDEGSDSEKAYLKLAQNNDVHFRLGWHVLRNRDFGTRSTTLEERNRAEMQFFSQGVWTSMSPSHLRIANLRKRLTSVLHDQVLIQLPEVVTDLEKKVQECKLELKKIGPSRATAQEQRQNLIQASHKFYKLMKSSIDGDYTDPSVSQRRGRARKIVDTYLVGPGEVCRDDFLLEVKKLISMNRGRELPGTYNPAVISQLFRKQSKPWKGILDQRAASILGNAYVTARGVLEHILEDDVIEGNFRWTLNAALNEIGKSMKLKLEEIMTLHETLHPITYNQTLSGLVQKRLGPQEQWIGHDRSDDQILLWQDLDASSDAVDWMEAYYDISLARTLDDFSALAVESCLMQKLPGLFSPEVVFDMDDKTVGRIAAENEASAAESLR